VAGRAEANRFKEHANRWAVLGVVMLLLAATGADVRLAAQPAPQDAVQASGDGEGTTSLQITLRVYNFPRLPRRLLVDAEKTATAIFRRAGVKAVWVDCPLTNSEAPEYPACSREMGFTDFTVRILNRSMAERMSFPERTLGFGLPCTDDRLGCYADVFYHRVEELSERGWGVPSYQILGHTLAHEVGHLLLGVNSHSPTGLMRATWDVSELQAMSHMCLRFTPQQSGKLRAEVLTRMRREHLVADSSKASARAP
jgi:hypothetical protein